MRAAALALACLPWAAEAAAQSSSRVAGGVVSSREWRVKRAGGEPRQEEFSGEVRYRTGPNVVRCDWALYDHEKKTWQLRGGVTVDRTLDSGDRARASGDTGFFDMASDSGRLEARDRVSFLRTPADGGEPDRATAGRLGWRSRRHAWLEDRVRIWGPRVEGWSDRADYDDATSELTLRGGRPVTRKFPGWDEKDDWAGACKADEIRVWRPEKRLAADGRVVGWLVFHELAEKRR